MKKKIEIEGLEVQTIADCYRVFRDKLKFPDYFSNNLNSIFVFTTDYYSVFCK